VRGDVDQLLADEQVTSTSSDGNTLWPLADHLGTIRDIADYDGGTPAFAITNHRVYDSFGRLESETNSAVDLVFGFTGKFHDADTGLNNYLNRWYDSRVGRWLSEDPAGFAAGDANLTRYVANSPTMYVDPLGLVQAFAQNGAANTTSAGVLFNDKNGEGEGEGGSDTDANKAASSSNAQQDKETDAFIEEVKRLLAASHLPDISHTYTRDPDGSGPKEGNDCTNFAWMAYQWFRRKFPETGKDVTMSVLTIQWRNGGALGEVAGAGVEAHDVLLLKYDNSEVIVDAASGKVFKRPDTALKIMQINPVENFVDPEDESLSDAERVMASDIVGVKEWADPDKLVNFDKVPLEIRITILKALIKARATETPGGRDPQERLEYVEGRLRESQKK
jgi:RHS repeat-associated protein